MSQNYSIKEILNAVDTINPERLSSKKFAKEEILDAVNEINKNSKVKSTNTTNLNYIPIVQDTEANIVIKKKLTKEQKQFTQPLLLTNIIKYEPRNTKVLFLKKLYNTKIKIISMKAAGANR